MSLRKFRKQAEGLDVEKLNRGEVRRRKKKAAEVAAEEEEESQVGLRRGKSSGRVEDDAGFVQLASLLRPSLSSGDAVPLTAGISCLL